MYAIQTQESVLILPGSRLRGAKVKYLLLRLHQQIPRPLVVNARVPPLQEWVNLVEKVLHCPGLNTPRLRPACCSDHSQLTTDLTPPRDRGILSCDSNGRRLAEPHSGQSLHSNEPPTRPNHVNCLPPAPNHALTLVSVSSSVI